MRTPSLSVAVLVLSLGASGLAGAEQAALYLRHTNTPVSVAGSQMSDTLLSVEAPPTGEIQTVNVNTEPGLIKVFKEFISAGPAIVRIPSPPLSAVLYLATRNEPMDNCATVTVDVHRRS